MNASRRTDVAHRTTAAAASELTAQTPVRASTNRPGLPAIAYRVGTHAQFKAAHAGAPVQRRLPGAGRPAHARRRRFHHRLLRRLGDGHARVLTFYQERIANEVLPAHGDRTPLARSSWRG